MKIVATSVEQLRITPAMREEILARPDFDDAPVVQDHDFIQVMNGCQPVRDDESRTSFHQFLQRVHDRALGGRIERAGWFVEQENR